jgi:NADPH2:quinone reductase
MHAIIVRQFGAPDVLKLEELPTPRPSDRELLVRIHAVGVNPVDTYIRAGTYPMKPDLPYTPGTDAAGVVEAVGSEIKLFAPGDRVYIGGTTSGKLFGAYASHAICDETHVHPLPDNVTFQQGAGVNVPFVTAYRGLFQRANAKPGEFILVHGASGGVGIAAVQLAVAAGMRVIGTASTPRGQQLVKDQGAHFVVDHSKSGYIEEILQITGGVGVDVILEMLANVNLDNDLKIVARFGRIAVIGNRGRIEIDPRQTMAKESCILGVAGWADARQLNEIHSHVFAGLQSSTLCPVVGSEMPLKDAARAHEQVMKSGANGKIVLIP